MAGTAEKYLKPEVIRQVSRLDLRAKFIVEGFIAGLHASPFHGFSVEFSEHRKYTSGDNISDIDWNVFAKTDRFYIKKFQAETNLTGYLVMDLSGSMGYTYRQELTKFEYSISLAAALCYLMIHQQDPVGLIAFDRKVSQSLAPGSKRSQLGNILSMLAKLKPEGTTEIEASLHQVAGMLRHRSLIMLFSDLLGDPDSILRAIHRLRFSGHDLIIFHILDEAEAQFPFQGMLRLEDNETHEIIEVDADAIKVDYLEEVERFRSTYRTDCVRARIDYVPLHTGYAIRQGADELPVDAASPRLIDHGAHGHGNVVDACGPGGGRGPGRPAGDPAPVHAADAQARDLPGSAPDPRAAAPVEEADAGEELALAPGADGRAGPDGPGPGPAAGSTRRSRWATSRSRLPWAWSSTPACR